MPAAQAAAQEIHTCIDAKGIRSYQNLPCDPGQRTASVRSYEAKPEDPAVAARSAAIQQEMDRRNRPSGKATVVRTANRRPSGPTPCQAAKAKREATLKQVGLKRTFDLLSRLDSEVWDVCKGF
ncbi:MAG: DUF4124 domain-containing protein [Pseudomonadota bacterium]